MFFAFGKEPKAAYFYAQQGRRKVHVWEGPKNDGLIFNPT